MKALGTIKNSRWAIALWMSLRFRGVARNIRSEQNHGETIYYATFRNNRRGTNYGKYKDGRLGVIYTTVEQGKIKIWDIDEYGLANCKKQLS